VRGREPQMSPISSRDRHIHAVERASDSAARSQRAQVRWTRFGGLSVSGSRICWPRTPDGQVFQPKVMAERPASERDVPARAPFRPLERQDAASPSDKERLGHAPFAKDLGHPVERKTLAYGAQVQRNRRVAHGDHERVGIELESALGLAARRRVFAGVPAEGRVKGAPGE